MAAADPFFRALLDLDDESFFALIRNYLGPVKTPYNKHDLISTLVAMLYREETRARIVSRLDPGDRRVLSAVALLGNPQEGELTRFLGEDPESLKVHRALMNLRDRLVLIPGSRGRDSVIINPVLEETLGADVLHPERLVAGQQLSSLDAHGGGVLPWFSSRFIASLAAVIRQEPEFFTRTGTLRKSLRRQLEEGFGDLLVGSEGETRFRAALVAMETLELIRRDETSITLRRDSWDELADLPERWIQALLWGSTLTTSLDRAFDFAALILDLVEQLPADRVWTGEEMVRLMMLASGGERLPIDIEVPRRLALAEFLIQQEGRFQLNPAAVAALQHGAAPSRMVVGANMTITVPPGTPLADLLVPSRLARLRQFDIMPTFELTEEGFAGLSREDRDAAITDLQRVAGELPQNVHFLLQRWQARSGAVRLLNGLVLVLAEEARELVESSQEFLRHCQEVLAPGVYLIRPQSRQDVERLLQQRGLGGVVALEEPPRVDATVPDFRQLLGRYQQPLLIGPPRRLPVLNRISPVPPERNSGGDEAEQGELPPEEPGAGEEELHRHLKSMNLPEEAERELALRIDRKLILFPEQLRREIVPHAGVEARGLDYLGKIRLTEQAISSGELLEVIIRSPRGVPERLLVQPRQLVQEKDDLFLRAAQLPGEKAIRIRIRRASLVRRLSGTLIRRK